MPKLPNKEFSVLMSLYWKESPGNLSECLQSICNSTVLPSEVLVVLDGSIPNKLMFVLKKFKARLPLRLIPLVKNVGLPEALNQGILNCKTDLIARFDTDDICHTVRFERQLLFMEKNPDIAVVGSHVGEFLNGINKVYSFRRVAINHESIVRYAKIRNPLNHPSVMYRKSAINAVGGYPLYALAFEDYALWLNLILKGYKLSNLDEVLVFMRAGPNQAQRRRGIKYAKIEWKFASDYYRYGFFKLYEMIVFLIIRLPFRFLPNRVLWISYKHIIRK
jgi:glycosyltransferase involved in cell wall biosynthesis